MHSLYLEGTAHLAPKKLYTLAVEMGVGFKAAKIYRQPLAANVECRTPTD